MNQILTNNKIGLYDKSNPYRTETEKMSLPAIEVKYVIQGNEVLIVLASPEGAKQSHKKAEKNGCVSHFV